MTADDLVRLNLWLLGGNAWLLVVIVWLTVSNIRGEARRPRQQDGATE